MVSVIPNFPETGDMELICKDGVEIFVSVLLHAKEIIAIETNSLVNEIPLGTTRRMFTIKLKNYPERIIKLSVELRGIEPLSKHHYHKFSTCLFHY